MKKLCIFFIILILGITIGCYKPKYDSHDGIIINEICSSNYKSLIVDNTSPDWVELYNTNDFDIDLYGYSLSDNRNKPTKFVFSKNTIIKAKGYLVLYCTSDILSNLATGFKLSKSGEEVVLTNPVGKVIDSLVFPEMDVDISYGYINGELHFLKPTPGKENSDGIINKVDAPVFSNLSGFYENEFDLELSSNNNYKIYYTTDCSIPTVNSTLYNEPIHVRNKKDDESLIRTRVDISASDNHSQSSDKAFVIRAICVDDEGNTSNVITNSYFISLDKYKNKKVLSLVTDINNLLDEDTGIYVRGRNYNEYVSAGSVGTAPEYNWDGTGREWERDVNISLIDNGDYKYSQDAGFRIHGFGGRDAAFKSFNLYARNAYGINEFTYDFFGTGYKTSRLLLKYDRYSKNNERFKEGFLQDLSRDMDLATADYIYVSLFLDGEYMQDYVLFERYNEEYLYNHFNIDPNDAVLIKEDDLEYGNDEDYEKFKDYIRFVKNNDLSKEKNYEKFCNMCDVDSLIDFFITIIYFNNADYSYKKNVFVFKCKTISDELYHDNKWHYLMYDYDFACIDANFTKSSTGEKAHYDYMFDTCTGRFLFAIDLPDDIYLKTLMKNKVFREKFYNRFFEVCEKYYHKDIVLPILENKWKVTEGTLYTFLEKRFEYISEYFKNFVSSYE